jgi:two-component system NtrC family sensor kinase
MTMKLTNKFLLWSLSLLALVLMLGTVSIWNITGMWRAARATTAEYDAMDRADAASVQAAWLHDTLRGADGSTYRDVRYFAPIQAELTEIVNELRQAAKSEDGDGNTELEMGQAAIDHLNSAIERSSGAADPGAAKLAEAAAELDKVRESLQGVAKMVPGSARRQVTAASERLGHRLTWTCIFLLIALALSAGIHFTQFRALVRPLLWLRDDMRRSAAGNYQEQVRPRGDREFKDLATYFNGLAGDLANLYRGLEEKVIQRSRELVRSERLASVGFLAAGVAHEINNPLSVISGYAELAAKSLHRVAMGGDGVHTNGAQAQAEAEALSSVLEAQGIIRDEAFRCKEITSRLLSLARGNGDGRTTLCLDEVARQVTVLTKGLRSYRDRRVVLDFGQNGPLEIVANPTEMKQVILNLTVNALEAVPADRGEVRIGGRRCGEWIELSVEDNGKGMTPETLEHVFEPFFTAKRGAGEPGTGLGLSITHAIIENHGGRIRAESEGPGRGSRFTVRFPASAKLLAGAAGNAVGAG